MGGSCRLGRAGHGRRIVALVLLLSITHASSRSLTEEDRKVVCGRAANDGRWRQRTCQMAPVEGKEGLPPAICNCTLSDVSSPAAEDWEWSDEAVELCGVHHHSAKCAPSNPNYPLQPGLRHNRVVRGPRCTHTGPRGGATGVEEVRHNTGATTGREGANRHPSPALGVVVERGCTPRSRCHSSRCHIGGIFPSCRCKPTAPFFWPSLSEFARAHRATVQALAGMWVVFVGDSITRNTLQGLFNVLDPDATRVRNHVVVNVRGVG
jgi:hypothetical protein